MSRFEVKHTQNSFGVHTPLVVTRVIDRSEQSLRFLELHALIPGCPVMIEGRVPASHCVEVRSDAVDHVTMGTGAASKILVKVVT